MCIYVRNKETSDIHFIFVIYLREQLHQREKFPHKVRSYQFHSVCRNCAFPRSSCPSSQCCHYLITICKCDHPKSFDFTFLCL